MFEFLFDLPLIITGSVIVAALWLFSIVGLLTVRRHLLPCLRMHAEDSHFSATVVHSIMVFYGLAVALIAVSVSETYSDISKIVSGEARTIWFVVSLAQRDVSTVLPSVLIRSLGGDHRLRTSAGCQKNKSIKAL